MEKESINHTRKRMIPVYLVVIVLVLVSGYLLVSLKSKIDTLQGLDNATVTITQPVQQPTVQPQAQKQQEVPGQTTPQSASSVLTVTADDWVRGNKNAPLAMIVYSDYECGFCKAFHPTTKQVVDAYKDTVMLIYRHYPMFLHPNAQKEAEAAECAGAIGGNDAFWKYTDAIFERTTSNGNGFSLSALAPLAKEIGLDEAAFKDCLDTGKMTQIVRSEAAGGEKVGVTGTPATILLNVTTSENKLIPGSVPFDQLKPVIDGMLKI